MKKEMSSYQATYGPMNFKTFSGALESFFAQECPQLGGVKTRQVLVQSIMEMVHGFYPETSHLRQGQTIWTTVDKNEKSSYGKSIRNTRLTQVILDLVRSEDITERAGGKKLKEIKQEAAVRLFRQAYEQGGCMTNAEVAILLKISAPTISKYVREWEEITNTLVPRRGTIHDMGRSLTHKVEIINKLFLEGKSVEQVSRETYHSPAAIHRYIMNFKQVLLCRRKALSIEEIAFAVKISKNLVKEYYDLIDKMQSRSIKMEELLTNMNKMEQ